MNVNELITFVMFVIFKICHIYFVDSGQIEFDEFCHLLAQQMESSDKAKQLKAAFDVIFL